MPLKGHLRRTNRAANSAAEMPSGMHQDFFRRRTIRRRFARESIPKCASTSPPDQLCRSRAHLQLWMEWPPCREEISGVSPGAEGLFKEQVHAVEIDDSATERQQFHADDSGYMDIASMFNRKIGQSHYRKFLRWHMKVANHEVIEFAKADPARDTIGKTRRHSCAFERESKLLCVG